MKLEHLIALKVVIKDYGLDSTEDKLFRHKFFNAYRSGYSEFNRIAQIPYFSDSKQRDIMSDLRHVHAYTKAIGYLRRHIDEIHAQVVNRG